MVPQPVDVAVVQPGNPVLRRRVGVAHQSAERRVHDVVRLIFQVTGRAIELHRRSRPAPEAGAQGASRFEIDVGNGAGIIDRGRGEAEGPVVKPRRPPGRGDIQRIGGVSRLAEWQGQSALRAGSPQFQHGGRGSDPLRSRAQDAVEEVEIHPVPGREVVAAVLALPWLCISSVLVGGVVCAVDIGPEPVARRIGDVAFIITRMPLCREAICPDVSVAMLWRVRGERKGTPEKCGDGDTVPT